MKPALIIGYGSPLRGDDAFGWHAAHRLATLAQSKWLRVLAIHQLTPELAEPVSEAELVIFIDASLQGEPGTWQCEEIGGEALFPVANSLAHYSTPTNLLILARTIYDASPRALLFSFAARSFDYSETLTRKAKAAFSEMLPHVLRRVQQA